MSVTLAAEKASAPKHSEKRRVRVSAVLARKEFIRDKSEHGEIETKSTCFTRKGWWGVNLGCTNATAGGLLPQSGGRPPTRLQQAAAGGWLASPCPNTAAVSPAGLLPCFLTRIKDAFVLPGEENKPPCAHAWHL